MEGGEGICIIDKIDDENQEDDDEKQEEDLSEIEKWF